MKISMSTPHALTSAYLNSMKLLLNWGTHWSMRTSIQWNFHWIEVCTGQCVGGRHANFHCLPPTHWPVRTSICTRLCLSKNFHHITIWRKMLIMLLYTKSWLDNQFYHFQICVCIMSKCKMNQTKSRLVSNLNCRSFYVLTHLFVFWKGFTSSRCLKVLLASIY